MLVRTSLITVCTVGALCGPAAAQQEVSAGREQAAPSVDEIAAAIAATRADIAALEEIERRWAAMDELGHEQLGKALDSIVLLESRLDDVEPGSAEVEEIFDRTKPMVRAALDVVWTLLRKAGEPREIDRARGPGPESRRDWSDTELPEAGSPLTGQLQDLLAEERRLEEDLARREIDRRIDAVERSIEMAGRIWQVRLAALHRLPLSRKSEILSFQGEGREQLRVEFEAIQVIGRVQVVRARDLALRAREGLVDVVSALRVGTLGVKLLIVLLLWRWAQANRERYLLRARERVAGIADPQQRERAGSGVEFLAAVAPWSIFLATLYAVRWVIGDRVANLPGIAPTILLLAVYGLYRLISDVAIGLLADAMRRSGVDLSDDLRVRLTRRARWVIRIAMIGVVIAWFIDLRIGPGVIHAHVRTFTLMASVATLFLTMGGLRDQIADLFLATSARGPMATLVRRTRGRFTGRLVAPLAFVWLAVASIGNLIRGAFASLESTRAATAYIARRRLQRSAESGGYASGRVEDLPPEVVARLSSTITVSDLEALDLFPGLDVCQQAIARWRNGEGGGSFLLAGDEGVGKRAWVTRLVETESAELRMEPRRRILNGKALLRWLAAELLGEDQSLTRGQLVSRLEEGPQRIVVIERAERLFLTTVNGYHALAELGPVVDATRHKVFWVVSMGGLAYRHLSAARKDLAFLRRQQWLDLWEAPELRALIEHRLEGSGLEIDHSSLVSKSARREDLETRDRQGQQAYASLLSDFAGGNPKVCLYYFLRSLEPTSDGNLRIRPFMTPDEAELEAIDESALFILAAVARHGTLTPREAARAADYGVGRVHGRLVRLHDLGVVEAAAGSYHVTTAWRSTVLRVLRRHNILTN